MDIHQKQQELDQANARRDAHFDDYVRSLKSMSAVQKDSPEYDTLLDEQHIILVRYHDACEEVDELSRTTTHPANPLNRARLSIFCR